MALSYRFAEPSDCGLYHRWRNEEEVRSNSFDPGPVSLDAHKEWFYGKLADKGCVLYVVLADGVPAGQVRFDIEGKEAVISISIDKDFRGRSVGKQAIKDLSGKVLDNGADKVVAYIKPDNLSSIRAFTEAGYGFEGDVRIKGSAARKYVCPFFAAGS